MNIDHSDTDLERPQLTWSSSLSEHKAIDNIFARLESGFTEENTSLSELLI